VGWPDGAYLLQLEVLKTRVLRRRGEWLIEQDSGSLPNGCDKNDLVRNP